MPARQKVHCVAPALDVSPGGHAVQLDAPGAAENVPGAHKSATPVPSHIEPAGHSTHVVRSALESPPSVYEPAGQMEQLADALSLYKLPALHAVHVLA